MSIPKPFWYVAFLKGLPDAIEEGVLLAEGFSVASPEEIPLDELAYALLFRTVATSEPEASVFVGESIQSLALGCECPTAAIALEPECIRRSEKRAIAGLSLGDVAMHSLYVGFKRGNAEAREMAMAIIRSALSKRRWEFWK